MFIQVIQGEVSDAEHLRAQVQRWRTVIKPGATGYLGSTGGVTPDGRGIVLVRFEDEEAALANSNRPDQAEWWAETVKAFAGDIAFHNCAEVDAALGGGSNDAGFVQVIQGRAKDQDEMRRRGPEMEGPLREARPDILGITVAWHGDGGAFTQAVYFTSQQAAREGEAGMENGELRQEFMALMEGPLTFYDLTEPDLD